MSTLSVLLLCSNPFRVRQLSRILAASGLARVQVICGESDLTQFPPELGEPDLVICDSLHWLTSISYFRRLCEHYRFFSVIECEGLQPSIRWGLANFSSRSGKYCVGTYDDLLDTAQIGGLLLKALTVKCSVKNHSRGSASAAEERLSSGHSWLAEPNIVQALEEQQIVPYFQPKICLKTRRTLGVEVLARWKHPYKGLLGPQCFLHLFNSRELHQQLFDCLLQQGLKLHRHLHSIGEALVFSYNVEASQLADPGFASGLLHKIAAAGVPKSQITLEITEREALTLDMQSVESICVLVKSGLCLSLDDFGTGQSSIMRLSEIPFGQIKLDSGFVANALRFKETRIIEAVVELARSLDLELVAEGVETEKHRAHLQRLGVDAAQGYLFYKPMNSTALVRVLFADEADSHLALQG